MINVFQPSVGAAELAAVAEVFEGNWLGRGPRTALFERTFANHIGLEPDRVTSIGCCTEALFIAVQLAGAAPGDEVVLPTVSFVGAANAVAAAGARPVFCDVDEHTLNPTVEDIAAVLTPRTRAVILLHYGGYPGDVLDIAALCRDRGVALIEDAACAVSSRVAGRACGTFGDIGTWSFDAMKIVVAGDGGMLAARDPDLVASAGKLAYLGLNQPSGYSQAGQSDRWWEFEVDSFARRSIMNDVQSAIGAVQLTRVDEFIARRREVAARYDRELADLPGLRLPPALPSGHESSYYLYWIQLTGLDRDQLARDLRARGVYTTFRYAPLHQVAAYGSVARLPRAERAAANTLCLPIHQGLSDDDVGVVIGHLRELLDRRAMTVGHTTGRQ